jgi:hypothetical protein
VKESIISISKPTPKVQPKPLEDEPQPEITQTEEISWTEELQQPESLDPIRPTLSSFASTSYGGWKPSDILREIRLDNFDIGSTD